MLHPNLPWNPYLAQEGERNLGYAQASWNIRTAPIRALLITVRKANQRVHARARTGSLTEP